MLGVRKEMMELMWPNAKMDIGGEVRPAVIILPKLGRLQESVALSQVVFNSHVLSLYGKLPEDCIPAVTAGNGWKLQAIMQWIAAYGMPCAVGISNSWGKFTEHAARYAQEQSLCCLRLR